MKDLSNLVGYARHSASLESAFGLAPIAQVVAHPIGSHEILLIENFISNDECKAILDEMSLHTSIAVGQDGYANHYEAGSAICSGRNTLYSESIASVLFERIRTWVNNTSSPYHAPEQRFTPDGVNPALRLIDYPSGGYLVPHYDFPYCESERRLSLYSVVVFLTTNKEEGATRFIREYRNADDSDWSRQALQDEVLFSVKPVAGSALIFPHNILHEGQSTSRRKTILRTDVMYKEIA
jgi:hypothetical protein